MITLAGLALVIAGIIVSLTTGGRVRHRLEKLLSDRFDSSVEIGGLSLSFFPIASVRVTDIKMRYHHRTDVPPMITISGIDATSDLASLIFGAQHDVTVVRLNGLHITIAAERCSGSSLSARMPPPGKTRARRGITFPL